MSKKIVFVNSRLSGGGSERVMCLLANEFAARGYDVTMLLVREADKQIYEVTPDVKLVQFNYSFKNKIYKFISRVLKIRKILRTDNPDFVISFMSDVNLCTLFAGLFMNKKIIISERNDPVSSKRSFVQRFLEKKLYAKAYKVVLQTNDVVSLFPRKVAAKSVVIPNPINPALPLPYSGVREKIVVAAGRLAEQKNFSLLIRSFKKFHEEFSDYKLEIYGKGALEKQLSALIDELELSDCAFLKGYVDDVDDKIRTSSMYISSSDYEGISNSMLEALAMGVPTICTDCPVGGARMAIENNVNGFLVPVGDIEALYNAMKLIASDEALAKRISDEASKIRGEYSIKSICDLWIDIL